MPVLQIFDIQHFINFKAIETVRFWRKGVRNQGWFNSILSTYGVENYIWNQCGLICDIQGLITQLFYLFQSKTT